MLAYLVPSYFISPLSIGHLLISSQLIMLQVIEITALWMLFLLQFIYWIFQFLHYISFFLLLYFWLGTVLGQFLCNIFSLMMCCPFFIIFWGCQGLSIFLANILFFIVLCFWLFPKSDYCSFYNLGKYSFRGSGSQRRSIFFAVLAICLRQNVSSFIITWDI